MFRGFMTATVVESAKTCVDDKDVCLGHIGGRELEPQPARVASIDIPVRHVALDRVGVDIFGVAALKVPAGLQLNITNPVVHVITITR